jgi:GntR family transcriptional regulator, transcriptional repressor for pyruvate dehydrogenase complex
MRRIAYMSNATQAADALAEEILRHNGDEAEWLLGSESSLMEQLGVGRPTLRQAARMLEQNGLLIVRRGVNGGVYGRRPTSKGVSNSASWFLRSQNTTVGDLFQGILTVAPSCAAAAARNRNVQSRETLIDFYGPLLREKTMPLPEFLQVAPSFQRAVAELSESPVHGLFIEVLMDLTSRSKAIRDIYSDSRRRRNTVNAHQKVAHAIADGDPLVAFETMDAHFKELLASAPKRALSSNLEPAHATVQQ